MQLRRAATRAILHELETIRRVTTVLFRNVVALLALRAGQSNLRANVRSLASHPFSFQSARRFLTEDEPVAGAGLEPATSRL